MTVKAAIAAAAALVTAPLGLVVLLASTSTATNGLACLTTTPPAPIGGVHTSLDADQTTNATTILTVGIEEHVPDRGLLVALVTAVQESDLHNLPGGDADSVGLFQQRPSAGWGTPADLGNPVYAAQAFFGGPNGPNGHGGHSSPAGLLDVPAWQILSIGAAAQAVQHSAFPHAYDRWVSVARGWLTQLLPAITGTSPPAPGAAPALPAPTAGTLNCGTPANTGTGTGRAWGGFANGQIPTSALCPLAFAPDQLLRCDAASALDALNTAHRVAFGTDIVVTDSYRSLATQIACRQQKGDLCAVPGTSNHGWGLAADLGGGIETFGTRQHQWMIAHGPTSGWVHPAWAEPNGSKPEPWHFEYAPTH